MKKHSINVQELMEETVYNKILTKLFGVTLSVSKLSFDIGFKLKVSPFKRIASEDDSDSIKIERGKDGRLKKIGYYWKFFQMTMYSAYIMLGLMAKVAEGNLDAATAVHGLKFVVFGCGVMVGINTLRFESECISVINGVDSIRQKLRSEGHTSICWWKSIATIVPILGVFTYSFFITAFFALTLPFIPNNSMYFTSLLPEQMTSNLFVLILAALYESYICYVPFVHFMLIITVVWGFFSSILKWMPLLKEESAGPSSLTSEEKFYLKLENFSQLCILTATFNGYLYDIISIMIFAVGGMTTMCLYIVLTRYESLPLHIYLLLTFQGVILVFIIFVTFSQFGKVHGKSTSLLKLWKTQVYELGYDYGDFRVIKVSPVSFWKGRNPIELQMKLKSLKAFGIRAVRVFVTIKMPQRMVEQILTYLVLLLSLKI